MRHPRKSWVRATLPGPAPGTCRQPDPVLHVCVLFISSLSIRRAAVPGVVTKPLLLCSCTSADARRNATVPTSYVRQLLAVWYATQPEIRPNLEAALSSSYVRAVAPPSLWAYFARAASTMPVGSMDAVRNWFLLYSPSSTVFSPPPPQRGSFRRPPPPAPQPSPPSPPGWAEGPACAAIRHGLQAPVCLNAP